MRCNLAPSLLLPLALAACASDGDYPSLAIRDAERVSGTLQPPEPYVPTPIAPAVADRLEQLTAQAAAAHRAFVAEAPRARNAVQAARGAGLGSDSWAVAQVAVGSLESARSKAMIALADLDRLYVDAATEGSALARVAAARDAAIVMVEEESATIDGLLRSLGG